MRTWLFAFGVAVARTLSAVSMWVAWDATRPPDVAHGGTWCCEKCEIGFKVKCSGCTPTAKTLACVTGDRTKKLDCPGPTVRDGETVTCY